MKSRTVLQKVIRPGLKVGILGGGQLARMLATEAHRLGYAPYIYSSAKTDPAALVTVNSMQGALDSSAKLKAFLQTVDVATFESEFLDAKLLKQLSSKTKTPIFPRPEAMDLIQDRLTQKRLLIESKIPTADFIAIDSVRELEFALEHFSEGFVLKARRFGYDGYGTFIVRTSGDRKKAARFLQTSRFGFIAESLIKFQRELALLAVRDQTGDIRFFPWVETKQQNNQCHWVMGPLDIDESRFLQRQMANLLEDLNYIGALAFEFFESKSGILVNEMAPRVHNSGHYSLDAMVENQFSAHIKAVAGSVVGDLSLKDGIGGFAMVNLLGKSQRAPSWKNINNASLHWYGKAENRPRRKMGHVTCVGRDQRNCLKLALKSSEEVRL